MINPDTKTLETQNPDVLFINACVRQDSRTKSICNEFIKRYTDKFNCNCKEICLDDLKLMPVDNASLTKRYSLLKNNDINDKFFDLANEFKKYKTIIIGAPYWDLSFPSCLKVYLEHICVTGITFEYGKNGTIKSLCDCDNLIFCTTSGGFIGKFNSGEVYLKDFCELFDIKNFYCQTAQGLDVVGNDVNALVAKAKEEIIAYADTL